MGEIRGTVSGNVVDHLVIRASHGSVERQGAVSGNAIDHLAMGPAMAVVRDRK